MMILRSKCRVLAATLLFICLSGCYVTFVPDYDASIEKQVIEVTEMVDILYRKIEKKPEGERSFSQFADSYFDIETKMNSLLVQQKVRPQNNESVLIVEITRDKIQKYERYHEKTDDYLNSDLKDDRKILRRMLQSMLSSEKWKKATTIDDE